MAGEVCVTSNKKKNNRITSNESGRSEKDSEIEIDRSAGDGSSAQTRGGVRVYKIVVLGDGGVGKSG